MKVFDLEYAIDIGRCEYSRARYNAGFPHNPHRKGNPLNEKFRKEPRDMNESILLEYTLSFISLELRKIEIKMARCKGEEGEIRRLSITRTKLLKRMKKTKGYIRDKQ